MIFKEPLFFLTTNSTILYKHELILFSSDTRIFVYSIFRTTDTIHFHCFYIVYSTSFSRFLISSFISLYSPNSLFTKANSLCLIYKVIKALEIETLIALIFLLTILFFVLLSCFLDDCLIIILFDSCSDCTNFWSYYKACNAYRNRDYWSKCRNWSISTDSRNENKKMFKVIQSPKNDFYVFSLIKSYFIFTKTFIVSSIFFLKSRLMFSFHIFVCKVLIRILCRSSGSH